MKEQEISEAIKDIFFKSDLEHLIQSEKNPVTGKAFCETCQDYAEPMCYAINACLTVASHDLIALFKSQADEREVEVSQELFNAIRDVWRNPPPQATQHGSNLMHWDKASILTSLDMLEEEWLSILQSSTKEGEKSE